MSGLIIEGICAAGKSMIFDGLAKKTSYMQRKSRIQLSEHLTERIIENIDPTLEQRMALLDNYVDTFSLMHHNFYNSRFKDTTSKDIIPCFLIERFHLTHAVEALDFGAFKAIDQQLNTLDFKLLVLKMDEGNIKERLEDTFHRRPRIWYNYVMSFGGIDGACKKYRDMQNILLEYASQSTMPTYIIDTTFKEWSSYIDEAEKLWDL